MAFCFGGESGKIQSTSPFSHCPFCCFMSDSLESSSEVGTVSGRGSSMQNLRYLIDTILFSFPPFVVMPYCVYKLITEPYPKRKTFPLILIASIICFFSAKLMEMVMTALQAACRFLPRSAWWNRIRQMRNPNGGILPCRKSGNPAWRPCPGRQ